MSKSELSLPAKQSALLERLAGLLEQASMVARELNRNLSQQFVLSIPELRHPKHVPKDQEWFWGAEWQNREREVNEDLKTGRYKIFNTVEELVANLDART